MVFLLGANKGVAAQAAHLLRQTYPGLNICGTYSPSYGFEKNEAENAVILAMLASARPDILFVGVGAPKQEIWIIKHRHLMPKVKVFMGVGATIDYEAGAVKRSPPWMSRVGLEWLHRLVTQPGRYWRRYLRNMEYFWLLLLDVLGRYKSPMNTKIQVRLP